MFMLLFVAVLILINKLYVLLEKGYHSFRQVLEGSFGS